MIGLMREVGAGTDKSEISAVKNYKEASDRGVFAATMRLADLYRGNNHRRFGYPGSGFKVTDDEAAELLALADEVYTKDLEEEKKLLPPSQVRPAQCYHHHNNNSNNYYYHHYFYDDEYY